ncbi:hypothetical protein QG516_03455 [Pedobacter gandavensis]|uniref:NACHT domain-containing protein n=1 Tax=Pedobacter gandavensis TaxID=2679963 RepID=UPI002478CFD7|nr:hypothetical protein [Pedobacter gandavensis]WGQ10711.1 hypothetical protein QG516_03455 [Pedobacter gandavensis]
MELISSPLGEAQVNIFVFNAKKTPTLGLAGLKTANEEFEKNRFTETSDTFIIATSSDCQTKNIQDYIKEQEIHFLSKHNIAYQVWDLNYIELALREHYRIVEYYFGISEAKKHCFGQAPLIPIYPAIQNYIPRFLGKVDKENENPFLALSDRTSFKLIELLNDNPGVTKRFCLIADPYEGKSALLQQTAHELMTSDTNIVPLVIIMKDTSPKPIANTLASKYKAWQSIPICNLIIMIDGLDEVPMDRFDETVTLIKEFVTEYPFVNILFTCRSLFFFHFQLKKELENFGHYQLRPLGYYYIDQYLQDQLGNQKSLFTQKIKSLDLEDLLKNPFYLIHLTKWFKDSPRKLPSSKIEMVEKFIQESLEASGRRKLSGGFKLDAKRVAYKKVLKKFALALQIAGLNATPKEFVQELFSTEDQELLQNGSIITINNNSWSFNNAMFQEQLAAQELISHEPSQVIKLICVGEKVRKINTKWIQTVATYLSLAPPDSEVRKMILDLIRKDNMELLTLSDRSKFSPEFRLEVIKSIISRSIKLNTRLLLVNEFSVAGFIGTDPLIVNYLIGLLKPSISERLKVVVCRTLKHIVLSDTQQKDLLRISLRDLRREIDPYYAKLLLDLLARYAITDERLLTYLIANNHTIINHDFRSGIYRYLVAVDKVDENYQFGLDGFEMLISHNTGISHHGSEHELENFLLNTKDSVNVRKLYTLMESKDWQMYYHDKGTNTAEFISKLGILTTKLYQIDKLLIFPVVNFLITADSNHLLNDFSKLFSFFTNTKTNCLAVQLYLLNKSGTGYHFHFTKFLTPEANELLIRLHDDGDIEKSVLYSFLTGYYRERMSTEGDAFRKSIDQVFGKEPVDKKNIHNVYEQSELIKQKNDLLHISSIESFKQAVRDFFAHFKNKTITSNQLYWEPRVKSKRTILESNHLFAFIQECMDDQKKATLDNCLEKLQIPGLFDTWRAKRLLEHDFKQLPSEELKQMLLNFYYQRLPETEFQDTLGKPSTDVWYPVSVLVAQIWQKFQFETSDEKILQFLWVISGGINAVTNDRINKRESIADALLGHFEEQKEKLGRQVIDNLNSGITSLNVQTSHLELCKILKLHAACPILIKLIKSGNYNSSDTYHMINIYNHLDGDLENLIPYFRKQIPFANYIYMQLVKLFIGPFPEEVIPGLTQSLSNPDLSEENKIESAKYLAHAGIWDGFEYLINSLCISGKPPYEIQSNFTIWNVDTKKALRKLNSVMHMFPDTSYHREPFYRSPDRFILEILNGLAEKTEEDLLLVYKYYYANMRKYRKEFPNSAGDLIWYAEMALEKFRERELTPPTVTDIRKIVFQISA